MVPVTLTAAAQKQITELPKSVRMRIDGVIERLEKWPQVSGVRPLRGELSGHYRVRTGDYRVQFRVSDNKLIVEKVGHRDGFYED